jgi:hypothetical protein
VLELILIQLLGGQLNQSVQGDKYSARKRCLLCFDLVIIYFIDEGEFIPVYNQDQPYLNRRKPISYNYILGQIAAILVIRQIDVFHNQNNFIFN